MFSMFYVFFVLALSYVLGLARYGYEQISNASDPNQWNCCQIMQTSGTCCGRDKMTNSSHSSRGKGGHFTYRHKWCWVHKKKPFSFDNRLNWRIISCTFKLLLVVCLDPWRIPADGSAEATACGVATTEFGSGRYYLPITDEGRRVTFSFITRWSQRQDLNLEWKAWVEDREAWGRL